MFTPPTLHSQFGQKLLGISVEQVCMFSAALLKGVNIPLSPQNVSQSNRDTLYAHTIRFGTYMHDE